MRTINQLCIQWCIGILTFISASVALAAVPGQAQNVTIAADEPSNFVLIHTDVPFLVPLTAKDNDGSFVVSWDPVSGSTYYEYRICQQGTCGDWIQSTSASATIGIEISGDYTIDVRACNADGCGSVSSSEEVGVNLPATGGGNPTAPDWSATEGSVVDQSNGFVDSVTANQSVGAVEGKAGVSGGAANYSIPVVVAPGRKGMQPSVSLNYSSRSGNGVAGVGWGLSASSSIHRCGKTAALDGVNLGVQYTAEDKLCIDGQRLLVISGNYGVAGAQYRTELNGFSRVTQLSGNLSSINTYFTVESKDGQVVTYGNNILNNHSKVIPQGAPAILSWLIDSKRDRSNNAIHYDYSVQANSGEVLLSNISYTGTSNGTSNTKGNREVSFEYELRTDVSSQYLAGGLSRSTKRLKRITTQYNGAVIREYTLGYKYSDATKKSLLLNVEECAYDAFAIKSCLPKTEFDWMDDAITYELQPFTLEKSDGTIVSPFIAEPITHSPREGEDSASVNFNEIMPRGDFNGDGVKDWFSNVVPARPGYIFNAEGKNAKSHTFSTERCGQPNAIAEERGCSFADFNLDGRTDTWVGTATSSQPLKLRYTQLDSNGNPVEGADINTGIITQRDHAVGISRAAEHTQPALIPDIADYNGDGFPDLFIYNQRQLSVHLHNGNINGSNPYPSTGILVHTYPTAPVANPFGSTDYNTQSLTPIGDIDGNGLPDFLLSKVMDNDAFYGNGYYFLPTPRPIELKLTHVNASGALSFTSKDLTQYLSNDYYSRFMDINGDGLLDLISQGAGTGSVFRLNNGKADFGAPQTISVSLGPIRNLKQETGYEAGTGQVQRTSVPVTTLKYSTGFRIADIDGDGRSELLIPNQRIIESCLYKQVWSHQLNDLELKWHCGEELYGRYWKHERVPVSFSNLFGSFIYFNYLAEMPGAEQDDSIYQFDAIYFDENADGTITTRKEDSGFMGPMRQGEFIDAYGNGLTDFVFVYGPTIWDQPGKIDQSEVNKHPLLQRNFDTYVYRNRGSGTGDDYAPVDMLKSVNNGPNTGMNVQSSWSYAPLSTGAKLNGSDSLYESDYDATDQDADYFHFTSSMYVVSQFKQSDGVGTETDTQYRYKGAMYNTQGRGFQGFNQITVDSVTSDIRSVTDFHQKFPLAGQIKEARTCLVSDSGNNKCENAPITKTIVSDYEALILATNPSNQSLLWVYPKQTVKSQFDLNNRATELSRSTTNVGNVVGLDVDLYGNILKSISVADNGFDTTQVTSTSAFDYSYTNNWWLNKIQSSSVETHTVARDTVTAAPIKSGSDPDKTSTTSYDFSAQGISHRVPTTVTTSASDTAQTHTVMIESFSPHGLATQIKTIGTDADNTPLPARTVTTSFSPDGYFAIDVTNALGHTLSSTTDPKHGQVANVTDANGITVTNTYDAFGRLQSNTVPGGQLVEKGYQWCSNCWVPNAKYFEFVKQEGSPTVKTYKDQFNRPLLVETQGFNGNPLYTQVKYDALGRKTLESTPSFNSANTQGTRYTSYDALGRLLSKETDQTDGVSTMLTTYNYLAHKTDITAQDSGQTLSLSRTYAADGKLIRTIDAELGATRYAYDSTGNPITLMDANSNSIYANYNGLGHKLSVDDPNMGAKQFFYNTFGEVEKEKDANGVVLAMQYDQLGRLQTRKVAGVLQASYSYDSCANGIGQVCQETTDDGSDLIKTFNYDSLSRPLSQVTSLQGSLYTTATEYDANYGRVKAMRYPSGIKVSNEYDAYGYQVALKNAATGFVYQAITERDEFLNMIQGTKNNGSLTESRHYFDVTGQLATIVVENTLGALQRHAVSYTYGAFGNLQNQQQWYDGGNKSSVENYFYDNLHRLTSSNREFNGVAHSEAPINYQYDAVGNLLVKDDYASSITYGVPGKDVRKAGPNAVSRIVRPYNQGSMTYYYDNNGNLRTRLVYDSAGVPQTDQKRTINYNVFNKPVSITKGSIESQFSYGADIMRYKQVKIGAAGGDETTLYLDKLVEIISKGSQTQTKTYIGDVAIVTKTETGGSASHKIAFTHRDRLGSVVTLTDHNNLLVEHRSYDPFGKPRKGDFTDIAPATLTAIAGGNPFTSRGFTDHEHLDDAELIHMNGRAYDYNLGRFLSVDPFIQATGNSQSINPYSYIMNNPLAATDPTGYCAAKDDAMDCIDSIGEGEVREVKDEDGNGIGTIGKDKNGKIHVTTDNGKEGQAAVRASIGKSIESIGAKPSDSMFNPNSPEFREDPNDPRNIYGTREYDGEGNISQSTGEYSRTKYGSEYSYRPAVDEQGNVISRKIATKWKLIREPSLEEKNATQAEASIIQAAGLIPASKYAKVGLELSGEMYAELADKYIWQRETRQELLYTEFRKDAYQITKGNLDSSNMPKANVYAFQGGKYTGSLRWGVIQSTRVPQTIALPKAANPNNMILELQR